MALEGSSRGRSLRPGLRRSSKKKAGAGASFVQQSLRFPNTWGGLRPGSGRKPISERHHVPHRARPKHCSRHPVHVTLRSAFRPLRSQHVFPTICLAIEGATRRDEKGFRILHFSVQWDHVHLVIEASDKRALSEGMRSLVIRIARNVNELVGRSGRFWADRWHGRSLTSPRAVRNALVYVLANFRKHAPGPLGPGIDAFSSAARFDGWRWHALDKPLPRAGPPFHRAFAPLVGLSRARTWLAAVGWRRVGLLRLDETPAPASG